MTAQLTALCKKSGAKLKLKIQQKKINGDGTLSHTKTNGRHKF